MLSRVRPLPTPRAAATVAVPLVVVLLSCGEGTVDPLPVVSTVALERDELTLTHLGETRRIGVVVRDQSGVQMTGVSLVWTSADASVASVDADGVVTAVENGRTTVRLTVESVSALLAVTVEQVADSVEISPTEWTFGAIGDTLRLEAVGLDAGGSALPDGTVEWTSADTSIVRVGPDGVVIAVGNGSTTVLAGIDGATGTAPVTVEQRVDEVEASPDSVVLRDPGDEATLTAAVRDRLGVVVEGAATVWSSSDTTVATVDGLGVVTAVETGATTIVASAGGVADTVAVRVEPELTLQSAGPDVQTAEVDAELTISARVRDVVGDDYPGATVWWGTADGSGEIVSSLETRSDATGHASAVWRLGTAAGTQRAFATIVTRDIPRTVEFLADARAGPAVTATLLADSILLSGRGETAYLAPTYLDAFANPTTGAGVRYTSLDEGVVTVSAEGLVAAAGEGQTLLTLSMGGAVDTLTATVAARGAVTLTFDDAFRSAYENAWPLLQELALPANVAVYTTPIDGGWPDYMTPAHLDELHDAGWSMVSHTVSHDTLTSLSDAQLAFELRAGQQWLEDRGYRGSNVFVAPYHEFADRERVAAAAYFTAARGTSANSFSPDSLVGWMPDRPYDLTGIDADQLPYTTAEGRERLRGLLDRVVQEGAFLDVLFHRIPPENAADLRALLLIVDEYRDRVLTYADLFPAEARPVY